MQTEKKHMNVLIDAPVITLAKAAAELMNMELREFVQETLRSASASTVRENLKGAGHESKTSGNARRNHRSNR